MSTFKQLSSCTFSHSQAPLPLSTLWGSDWRRDRCDHSATAGIDQANLDIHTLAGGSELPWEPSSHFLFYSEGVMLVRSLLGINQVANRAFNCIYTGIVIIWYNWYKLFFNSKDIKVKWGEAKPTWMSLASWLRTSVMSIWNLRKHWLILSFMCCRHLPLPPQYCSLSSGGKAERMSLSIPNQRGTEKTSTLRSRQRGTASSPVLSDLIGSPTILKLLIRW